MTIHALNETALEVEWRREQSAREIPCRVCGVPAGEACRTTIPGPSGETGSRMPIGHTGRYTDARAAGVLPPTRCRVCGDGAH